MPNRLDTIMEAAVLPQGRRLSDVVAENESVGNTAVYIPENDITKSYPSTMDEKAIGRDVRTYELKTEKPNVFPTISEALETAKNTAESLPVFGGFSAKQIMAGKDAAESTIFSKDREPAFKWFMLGMPEDLEGINKAETMGWADLFRESPVYKTSRDYYASNVGVSTAAEFGVNLTGEATEFLTDPASLLVMQAIGAGVQKGIPKGLELLNKKYPEIYSALTKELGTNKLALQGAYKTLGINPNATDIQIKKAYQNKALLTHPDRGGDPVEFDAATKAYDLINQSREQVFSKIYYAYKQSKLGGKSGFARIGSGGGEIVPINGAGGQETPIVGGISKPVVNIDRLNIPDEAKEKVRKLAEEVRPDLEKLKGSKITHEEVVDAAKTAEVLKNGVSRESTLKFESELLRTRQQLSALAEGKELTKEFIDTLRAVSAIGTDIARSLESMKIGADAEYAAVKIKIIKDLIKLGLDTDTIIDASKGVDFTKQKDVTRFYRNFVKPSLWEILDEFRYTNLLSSPKTHIVNTFSNIIQTIGLNPLTKLASGSMDYIGSQLSGRQRTHYLKQVPSFYRGAVNAAPKAAETALAILRGEGFIERPDMFRVGSGIEGLQVIPRLLEASDVFFRTMVYEGELEALKMNTDLTEAEKIERAKAKSEYYVFRGGLDTENKTGQGALLSTIDKFTRAAYALRNVPLGKWFIPFLQTPMNIFKQGIEYSPLGFGTTAGAKDKTEQVGKAMIGSIVFLWAAGKGLQGDLTWATPRSKREKDLFFASGRKPYSIRMGDKWVGYNRIGPLAYPLAMAAAWQYYVNENPDAVSDSEMEKAGKVFMGISEFLSDQSYLQGVGDFTKFFSGDQYAVGKSAANLAGQVIPLSSLLRWVNNFTDPFFRETEKGLSPDTIIQNIIKGIPFASNTLPALRDRMGHPVQKGQAAVSAFSPITVSSPNAANERLYQGEITVRRLNKKSDRIREDIIKKMRR